MTRTKIVPFQTSMIVDAAELLAARHARHRVAYPGLPPRFEDPGAAREALEAELDRSETIAGAAMVDDQWAGSVIVDVAEDYLGAPTAWIRLAGHALAEGAPAELYRELYAVAAESLPSMGCFDHYVEIPANDREALEAWHSLGFGHQQAHGLASLADAPPLPASDGDGLEIRKAGSGDADLLRDVAHLTATHQTGPPIWAPLGPNDLDELRDGYAELASRPDVTVWMGLDGDRVIGFQGYFDTEPSEGDMLTPERCVELKIASTRPEARGRGIGLALTRRGFAHAREKGTEWVLADWRMTNLLASRFWPSVGFEPVVYRLARRIDSRVVENTAQS